MTTDNAVRQALEKLQVCVPPEEHQNNAAWASSYAADCTSFLEWEKAGADGDDHQEIEVAAVAWLPDKQFSLLVAIAAAADGEKDGSLRYSKRVKYASQVDPTDLRVLVVWMVTIIDWLEDSDDDDGGNNGTPALRPRPRRKRRGFGMS
ncbi:MAG TPA: hypothetical protein VD865_03230 [Stenotrophomonas sp.]|nr:hypothetical protein [Stenotrophomonas sp.]